MPSTTIAARRTPLLAALLAVLLLLGGCAGVIRVDSQVESFASWDPSAGLPQAPQRYQFERLPSQHERPNTRGQDDLEQWTREELAAHGWQLAPADEAVPAWHVAVHAQSLRAPYAPWEVPPGGFWPSVGLYGGSGRAGFGMSFGWPIHPMWGVTPYFYRQVSIVIRDAATGKVAYETSATHDGRWNGTPDLWRAMIRAALTGFPAPPKGVHQVNIDLPR